jgi:hypothetical protein
MKGNWPEFSKLGEELIGKDGNMDKEEEEEKVEIEKEEKSPRHSTRTNKSLLEKGISESSEVRQQKLPRVVIGRVLTKEEKRRGSYRKN